jgi:hypothetical protein
MTDHHEKAIEAMCEAMWGDRWREFSAASPQTLMEEMRKVAAAYEAAMWMPIEEAPKGDPVIVGRRAIPCGSGESPAYSCEAFWSDEHQAFVFVGEHLGVTVCDRPTHFRPLPSLPEGGE